MVTLRARLRGFTAFELLTVLAISALLAALASPSFGELRRSAGVVSSANQMLWALHYARTSSLVRNLPTAVCLSADGANCLTSTAATGSGWLVFYDLERSLPPQIAGSDELLRSVQLPPGFTVRGTRSGVTFWPASRSGTTATFTICPDRGRPEGRAIVVSQTGRPRVTGAASCAA
jgi:type IV fimbrial biogenesis protein FimT